MPNWYSYDIKEAIIRRILADEKSSATGPVYSDQAFEAPGIQTVSFNEQRAKQTLYGSGGPRGTESSFTEMPVTLAVAETDSEWEAALYDRATWDTPEGTHLATSDVSNPVPVGLWARTDKTGIAGRDEILYIPRLTADALNNQKPSQNFETHEINASAAFTKSRFPTLRGGNPTLESWIWEKFYRLAGAPLFDAGDGVAPTLVTTNITGHAVGANIELTFSQILNPNTVNKFTILLKTSGGILVPCSVVRKGDTGDDRKKAVLNPTSDLTAATTYDIVATKAVRNNYGVPMEEDTITVTTAG